MRTLVLGGEGMLGHKVFQVLSQRFNVHATFQEPNGPWRSFPMYEHAAGLFGGVNALDFDSVVKTFAAVKPDRFVGARRLRSESAAASYGAALVGNAP